MSYEVLVGSKWSKKSKKKLSEAKLGKPHPHKSHPITEQTKRKISLANKGKPKPPRTEEHSRNISQAMNGPNNPNYGKKFSDQTRQRMRDAHAKAGNGRRKYKVPWNKHKHLSEEHRKHIAASRHGKPHPHK